MKIRELTLFGAVLALILWLIRDNSASNARATTQIAEKLADVMADAADRAVRLVQPAPIAATPPQYADESLTVTDVPDPFADFPLPEYEDDRIEWGHPGGEAGFLPLPDDHSPML